MSKKKVVVCTLMFSAIFGRTYGSLFVHQERRGISIHCFDRPVGRMEMRQTSLLGLKNGCPRQRQNLNPRKLCLNCKSLEEFVKIPLYFWQENLICKKEVYK